MNTQTISSSVIVDFPVFSIYRPMDLSHGLSGQVESAVKDFVQTCGVSNVDQQGFYQQTLKSIATMTTIPGSGDFWVIMQGERLVGYLIARTVLDIDDKLCYWISQAWVGKSHRGNPIVKCWFEEMRQRAKDLFCSHIVYVASRNPEAYKRFLRNGVHDYATLLKEDL